MIAGEVWTTAAAVRGAGVDVHLTTIGGRVAVAITEAAVAFDGTSAIVAARHAVLVRAFDAASAAIRDVRGQVGLTAVTYLPIAVDILVFAAVVFTESCVDPACARRTQRPECVGWRTLGSTSPAVVQSVEIDLTPISGHTVTIALASRTSQKASIVLAASGFDVVTLETIVVSRATAPGITALFAVLAAAIYVGLVAVFDSVATVRCDANAALAHLARTIRASHALQTIGARAALISSAVQVGLGTVDLVVDAARLLAASPNTTSILTVSIEGADSTIGTTAAVRATTVDVGFVEVPPSVRTVSIQLPSFGTARDPPIFFDHEARCDAGRGQECEGDGRGKQNEDPRDHPFREPKARALAGHILER